MNNAKRKIELLAPARDYHGGRCAVDFGADAIYIGAGRFGARHAATNSVEEVARLTEYAHQFGVRVYATLNTLLYDSELDDAQRLARELCGVGVDALIVQDMAFAMMELPDVELFASTQTCNMTVEGVRFLQESGFSRVILERGLTLEQIQEIRRGTTVDLEAFVHGAICVGFSGQCYLSRTMGERSGNRGNCGQSCRMKYDLVGQNGEVIVSQKHLLSVQDLNLTSHIGQLLNAGVTSFKIEGRLKDDIYIKNVVAHYRRVLDEQILGRGDCVRASQGRSVVDFEPDISKVFARGQTTYFLEGKRSGVASFETPKAMGEFVGVVQSVAGDSFQIDTQGLGAGDGVCFMVDGELVGTNINSVHGCAVSPNRMDGIAVGTNIFRNHNHRFTQTVEQSRTRRVIDIGAVVEIGLGKIVVRFDDQAGVAVTAVGQGEFEVAKSPDKMVETLKTQIAKSGDTIFNVADVRVEVVGQVPFVPISVVNELRREGLAMLAQRRAERRQKPQNAVSAASNTYTLAVAPPTLNVVNKLARQFYLQHGVESIECGFDLLENSVELVGERVMSSSYCIRREVGQCLLENPTLHGDLCLRQGTRSYLLEFDCVACEMNLIFKNT